MSKQDWVYCSIEKIGPCAACREALEMVTVERTIWLEGGGRGGEAVFAIIKNAEALAKWEVTHAVMPCVAQLVKRRRPTPRAAQASSARARSGLRCCRCPQMMNPSTPRLPTRVSWASGRLGGGLPRDRVLKCNNVFPAHMQSCPLGCLDACS